MRTLVEPELVIHALEDLFAHPGWKIVQDIIQREKMKAQEPAILAGKTFEQIAIDAVTRSASVQVYDWVGNKMIPQAIDIERKKLINTHADSDVYGGYRIDL